MAVMLMQVAGQPANIIHPTSVSQHQPGSSSQPGCQPVRISASQNLSEAVEAFDEVVEAADEVVEAVDEAVEAVDEAIKVIDEVIDEAVEAPWRC